MAREAERRAAIIGGVQAVIDKSYDDIQQSCLRRAKGDSIKAEALQDCSYWEYYYRAFHYNKYVEQHNAEIEKAGKQATTNK